MLLPLTIASLAFNAAAVAAAGLFVHRKGGWRFIKAKLDARGLVKDEFKARLERAYFLTKSELHAACGVQPGDTVFVGDSLTDYCPWAEWLGDERMRNRGISGDTTAGVLERLHPVVAGRPARVFLMIGINDLNNGAPVEEVFGRTREIVDRLMASSPETRVYVQSVLPVDTFLWGFSVNDRIVALNRLLAGLEDGARVRFVDLHPRFLQGDRLDPALSHDGLHLNARGYERWREGIRPLL